MNDGWEHAHGFDPLTHNAATQLEDDCADEDYDGTGYLAAGSASYISLARPA